MDEEDKKEAEEARLLETAKGFTAIGEGADADEEAEDGLSTGRGLGYTGDPAMKDHEEEMKKELAKSRLAKPKKAPSRGAFGVGILNDDGDDEDPYEIKPMSSYNRVIGEKKKKKEKVVKKPVLHAFVSKKAKSNGLDVRKCHDGRLPIEGFVLASEALTQDKWYAPPEVPSDWKPSISEGLDSAGAKPYLSLKEVAQASTLDPSSRAAILGEEPIPGKSIFDFLTPAARAKLVAATGRTDLPPALGEKPDAPPDPLLARIPHIDPATARSALSGFMPYQDDLNKRGRYRRYLEIEAGINPGPIERVCRYLFFCLSILTRNKVPGMSIDDFLSELSEFKNSARIFKPLPATMASRFTSSVSHSSQIATNTSEINPDNTDDPDTFLHRPSEQSKKPEDPAEAAAKLNMYGHLTRSIESWTPNRLLCKRFGVSFPKAFDYEGTNISRSRAKREWEEELARKGAAPSAASPPSPAQPARGPDLAAKVPKMLVSDEDILAIMRDVKGVDYQLPEKEKVEKVDVEKNEALEVERAGEEVFKAIFGDSDDEDEYD